MRFLLIAALAGFASPAMADACRDEIAALFDGGTLDPFARGAHRQTREVFGPDGTLLYTFDQIVQDPLHQISGTRGSGQYMMMVGNRTWSGPSTDGPWTAGMEMPGNMEAAQRAIAPDMARNLSDTACDGLVESDGRSLVRYRFRTKVDPHPDRGDSWWGSLDTVFIDPDSRRVVRWEQREHIASWAEGVKMETHVTTISYDDTIAVAPPD